MVLFVQINQDFNDPMKNPVKAISQAYDNNARELLKEITFRLSGKYLEK